MTAHAPAQPYARPLRAAALLLALVLPIVTVALAGFVLARADEEPRRAFARRLLVVSLASLGAGVLATLARL
jgi:VIT1/CCC1 family predicted Fe2+/Mn2+ transporter